MENGGHWISTKKACDFYGVSANTLRRKPDNNKVAYKRSESNQRFYYIPIKNSPSNKSTLRTFIYARVSSNKQKNDLERQSKFLKDQFPDAELVTDIASGLNYKRRGLLKLVDLSNKNIAKRIIISSKDRLCRFGFELLEWLFLQNNTELLVLEQTDKSPE
jgi:predicted site-specific integrase-resolvase